MFNHIDIDLPSLERETIDGVRYYKVPDEEELPLTGLDYIGDQSF